MTTVGRRGGRTPVGRPNNRNLFPRANRQLEAQASFQAERYNNALRVDGPAFYFWSRRSGSIPCSCSNAPGHHFNHDLEPGGANNFAAVAVGESMLDELEDLDSTDTGDDSLEGLFAPLSRDPAYQKHQSNLNDKLTSTETDPDGIDDSGLHEETVPGDDAFQPSDPLNLFNARVIDCPVCLGSGYIDSWQLQGGQRMVFETGSVYGFKARGVDLNERENPTEIRGHDRTNVRWTFGLPRVWDTVLKIGVYDGTRPVDPSKFTWTWHTEANNQPVTLDSLEELNGHGGELTLEIAFHDHVTMTHAEIVFAYREPFYAQIPEIAQGYEKEFLDWSINIDAELPTDAEIKEGDYLTEAKYGKVWKIGVYTPRVTSGGTIFGKSVNLRALHQFEKKATQLALFQPGEQQRAKGSGVYGSTGDINLTYRWDANEW